MPHTVTQSSANTITPTTTSTNSNNQSFVKKRTRATPEQLVILEETFAVNVSPNSKLLKQLAEKLKMNERSIQIWFQNRRAKVKHMQKRAHMQMRQAAMSAQFYHQYPSPFDSPADPLVTQPFYLPSHYMMKQPMMDYNSPSLIKSTPYTRSNVLPSESPMYYSSHMISIITPPPQESLMNHWHSTPSQPSPVLESNSIFPLFNAPYQLEKDFFTLDHGPISPSPTPNKEETSLSPFSTHQDKPSECPIDLVSMPSSKIEDGPQHFVHEPSLFSESDIWISTPGESYSNSPSIPCYPSFFSQGSMDIQKDGLNVTTLIIGIWQRMKYSASDLACCYVQDRFVWYIQEGGHQFKMEIPMLHVTKLEYNISGGDVHLHLSQSPLFYMKSDTLCWIQCSDFTENKQASYYLYHVLKGPHLQQDLLHLINEYPHLSSIIVV